MEEIRIDAIHDSQYVTLENIVNTSSSLCGRIVAIVYFSLDVSRRKAEKQGIGGNWNILTKSAKFEAIFYVEYSKYGLKRMIY